MTGAEIREFRKSLGMSAREFSEKIGSSVGSIVAWEGDRWKPNTTWQQKLEAFREQHTGVRPSSLVTEIPVTDVSKTRAAKVIKRDNDPILKAAITLLNNAKQLLEAYDAGKS